MRVLLTVIMLIMSFQSVILAQGIIINERVSLDITLRDRVESENIDFNDKTKPHYYNHLRSDIGININPNENVNMRFEIAVAISSGKFGNKDSESVSELNQVYVKFNRVFNSPVSLKFGRFDLEHGRGRVLGMDKWPNFRLYSFNGVIVNVYGKVWNIDLFASKVGIKDVLYPVPGMPDWAISSNPNFDDEMLGIKANFFNNKIQPILFRESDHESDYTINTIGIYAYLPYKNLELTGEYYSQSGDMRNIDVQSFLYAAEAKYTFNRKAKPRFSVGLDVTSGNKDYYYFEDKLRKFINHFADTHKFNGFMDYFNMLGPTDFGLKDYYLSSGFNTEHINFDLFYHRFFTYEDYYNYDLDAANNIIGDEYDFRVRTNPYDNMFMEWTYSYLILDDNITYGDVDNSSRWYLTFIVEF